MKVSEIWTFEDFTRKFLSFNGSELKRLMEKSGRQELNGKDSVACYQCPFCLRTRLTDEPGPVFGIDMDKGAFSCIGCSQHGDLIDLLSQLKYGGVKEREEAIYDLAFDFRIMPNIRYGVYKHYKGHYYLVSGVARDDGDSGHWRVLYRPLYGDYTPTLRTVKNFFEHVPEANRDRFTFAHIA